ncbi:MAG: universal stress protein [Desulfobacterales bacterium]|nr:universal stress protein [Desulfobacterales bacterium]MBS3755456.1 universal stress protein [Desulfobacterales bacterium]
MAKNVLIAFDDSENAMRSVNFVADYFARETAITLFSVLEDTQALCSMNSPELTPYFKSEQQAFCSLEDKKRELIETAIQSARNSLVNCGFGADQVRVKTQQRAGSVAKDIIKEAETGYDAVVIGRRGVSALQDFLFGSVAQKVLHGVKNSAVLIVP